MSKNIKWEIFSNGERNDIIEAIKDAISAGDGCIINFSMFSDLALTLSIKIEENKILELYNALSVVVKMPEIGNELNGVSKKEWLIIMNISFIKGKGTLKQEIPEVPG